MHGCGLTGDLRLFEGGVQVPWRVGVMQYTHLLESAAGDEGGRRPAEAKLRRRSPGSVQRSRHVAASRRHTEAAEKERQRQSSPSQPRARSPETGVEGRSGLRGPVARLLRAGLGDRVGRDARSSVSTWVAPV